MASQSITILNGRGGSLQAYLELPPDRKARDYFILAHCFTCHSNLNAVRHISRELTLKGFGVMRFDFTGLGRSDGAFKESHFAGNVEDLLKVASYMVEQNIRPCLLVGHSLGGAAALVAANRLDYVQAVVTIGTPSDIQHVGQHFLPQFDPHTESPQKVSIGGREFVIDQDFIQGFESIDLLEEVRQIRKHILVMHSPLDKIVDVSHAKKLYIAAHHPKSFISLNRADHLMSKKEDSLYAGRMIANWTDAIFPEEEFPLDTKGEQAVAHLDLSEGFTTTIQSGSHRLVADEPESVGGNDFGPSPYDLVLSGLAACTTMTLKMYAERKKWALDEVYVYLSHEKRHAEDMREEGPKKIDHIDKKIVLIGDLNKEQRDRLLEISKRCPVHRTLESHIIIESTLEKNAHA